MIADGDGSGGGTASHTNLKSAIDYVESIGGGTLTIENVGTSTYLIRDTVQMKSKVTVEAKKGTRFDNKGVSSPCHLV